MIPCPYCKGRAQLLNGVELYGEHREDLREKKFWACRPCGAWVGCHPGTERPLGTLAHKLLRQMRSKAHAMFDPLWKSEPHKRSQRYKWLADRLGIHPDNCHIGQFDMAQCRKVIALCKALKELRPLCRVPLIEQISQKRLTNETEEDTNSTAVQQ